MKNLIIIGAGGCGRELLQWVKDINKVKKLWNIKGFLDDDLNALSGKRSDTSIISTIKDYSVEADDVFVCGIGNCSVRKKVVELMTAKGAEFINLIHPTAIVAETSQIGQGVVLYPYSIISDNAVLADGCMVNMHSAVAHDSSLGEYCTISAYCDITGMCSLGNEVFMGTSAKLVPGTKVGNNAFICAGSMVMTRVKDDTKVMGNPAKRVKF